MSIPRDWYEYHYNIAALARWMAYNDWTAKQIAYMVEKPWKFTTEFEEMRADEEKGRAEAKGVLP